MSKLTLSRAAMLALCFTAITAGAANARERGFDRYLQVVTAAATANATSINQQGANNAAGVMQNGQGNSAGIRQFGRDNTGTVAQNGDNNVACLIQIGRGLDGSIVQNGDNQSTGIVQTRRGAAPIPAEACAIADARRGRLVSAVNRAANGR